MIIRILPAEELLTFMVSHIYKTYYSTVYLYHNHMITEPTCKNYHRTSNNLTFLIFFYRVIWDIGIIYLFLSCHNNSLRGIHLKINLNGLPSEGQNYLDITKFMLNVFN